MLLEGPDDGSGLLPEQLLGPSAECEWCSRGTAHTRRVHRLSVMANRRELSGTVYGAWSGHSA